MKDNPKLTLIENPKGNYQATFKQAKNKNEYDMRVFSFEAKSTK